MNRAIHWSAITVVGLGMALTGVAFAAETGVTILRGTAAKSAGATAGAGAPTVVRGEPATAARPDKSRSRSRPVASSWISTGGDTLWLVERHGGGIIGCWLQGSTYAGRTEVRCARR